MVPNTLMSSGDMGALHLAEELRFSSIHPGSPRPLVLRLIYLAFFPLFCCVVKERSPGWSHLTCLQQVEDRKWDVTFWLGLGEVEALDDSWGASNGICPPAPTVGVSQSVCHFRAGRSSQAHLVQCFPRHRELSIPRRDYYFSLCTDMTITLDHRGRNVIPFSVLRPLLLVVSRR